MIQIAPQQEITIKDSRYLIEKEPLSLLVLLSTGWLQLTLRVFLYSAWVKGFRFMTEFRFF